MPSGESHPSTPYFIRNLRRRTPSTARWMWPCETAPPCTFAPSVPRIERRSKRFSRSSPTIHGLFGSSPAPPIWCARPSRRPTSTTYALRPDRAEGRRRANRGPRVLRLSGDGRAEVAFAIADALQGKGLATILLAHLTDAAAEGGVRLFEAEILAENHRMVEVFRESGFPVEISSVPGSIHVEFPTSLSDEARERFENRDRIAAAAAVEGFLRPRRSQ